MKSSQLVTSLRRSGTLETSSKNPIRTYLLRFFDGQTEIYRSRHFLILQRYQPIPPTNRQQTYVHQTSALSLSLFLPQNQSRESHTRVIHTGTKPPPQHKIHPKSHHGLDRILLQTPHPTVRLLKQDALQEWYEGRRHQQGVRDMEEDPEGRGVIVEIGGVGEAEGPEEELLGGPEAEGVDG